MAARIVKFLDLGAPRRWMEVAVKGLPKWDLRERELELESKAGGGGFDVGKVNRLASIAVQRLKGSKRIWEGNGMMALLCCCS